jgi:hypothetical protein
MQATPLTVVPRSRRREYDQREECPCGISLVDGGARQLPDDTLLSANP